MEIGTNSTHPTLGLEIDARNMRGRLKLINCAKSTPAHRMYSNSTLRNSNVLEVEGEHVESIKALMETISKAKLSGKSSIKIIFAIEEKVSIHPQEGTPQLYFDQLNTIAEHLHEIETEDTIMYTSENDIVKLAIHLLKKKKTMASQFKRKDLQKQDDWDVWNTSEFTQLGNYEVQNTFGPPIPRPPNANILNLLWTYLVKSDDTKKARCVCNGSPRSKGTVTLGHTFAACLEQPGARVFWASAALLGMIVIGADASNAFAEAPPPKAPLYVVVDEQCREWWRSKGRGDIPLGHVMKVQCALQGHPESPRL